MKCQKCRNEFDKQDLWSLLHFGVLCAPCALEVLAYWEINSAPARAKIEAYLAGKDSDAAWREAQKEG